VGLKVLRLLGWWLLATIPGVATAVDMQDPVTADRVIRALAQVGVPYQRGGKAPETGFDCSGLVHYVFGSTVEFTLPRSSADLYRLDRAGKAQPVEFGEVAAGDLLFFHIGRRGEKNIDHVGIALGDGRFVHAPSSGAMVRIDSLDLPYWQKHYVGARRLPVAAAPVMVDALAAAGLPEDNLSLSESSDNPPQP
jgi:cell wall-associated NlpC family hydrolase